MIEHEILAKSQLRRIAKIIGKCQDCGTKCLPEPHRIIRGYLGGKYILRNLYFLGGKKACNCHNQRHELEQMGKK